MGDNKFSHSGFKYPERIYGLKFQHNPAQKPALLIHLNKSQSVSATENWTQNRDRSGLGDQRNPFKQFRYSKFGVNLGPNRPVKPIGKFNRE